MKLRKSWTVLAFVLAVGSLTGCGEVWESDHDTDQGIEFFAKKQYAKAETAFKEAIRVRRENSRAQYFLALLYLQTDRYGKAVGSMRYYIFYADHTRAWMGRRDLEYLAKIKALYTQQTGEIPVRAVSEGE